MSQKVTFAFRPTRNPDAVLGGARYVVNASSGIGMDALRQVVTDHIPSMDDDRETLKALNYETPKVPLFQTTKNHPSPVRFFFGERNITHTQLQQLGENVRQNRVQVVC